MKIHTIRESLRAVYWALIDSGLWRRAKNIQLVWDLLYRFAPYFISTPATLSEAFPSATKECVHPPECVQVSDTGERVLTSGAQPFRKKNSYVVPGLSIAKLENALYCPVNHVVMNSRRDVVNESVREQPEPVLKKLNREALSQKKVNSLSGWATTLRTPQRGYYHTLIDALPRIEYLARCLETKEEIKLLRPEGGPQIMRDLEDYFVSKLAPPNSYIVDLPPGALYQIENYILVTCMTRPFSGYLPKHYLSRFREAVLPERKPARDRRIYISRRLTDRRRVRNEEDLLVRLRSMGFESYCLETLSIEEQIHLFHDAEIVVAPHGAGLTNLIFSPPIPVIELFSTPWIIPHFYYLAQSLGHNYECLLYPADVSQNKRDAMRKADLEVDVNEVFDCVHKKLSFYACKNKI